jgi:hypothetical protein
MECEEMMKIIDMAIKLYEVLSMYSELNDIKRQLIHVVKSLFERAREVCQ